MRQVIKIINEKKLKTSVAWEKFDGLGYLLSVIGERHPTGKDYSTYDNAFMNQPFCFFQVSDAREKDEMTLRDNNGGLDQFIWSTTSTLAGIVLYSNTERLENSIENITFSEKFEFTHKNTVRYYFHQFFFDENVGISEFANVRDSAEFPKLESGDWECARKKILKNFPKISSRKLKTIYLLEVIYYLYFTNNKLQPAEVQDWIFNQLKNPDVALHSIILGIAQLERNIKLSNDDIIQTVQVYIANHTSECLNLEDLGKIVHLHPVYLSKLYKQETGENLSNYISFKRLEKAARLLIDSNLHVTDISHLVGYKKPQYFIKLFKDQYGITPYQYRRKQTT